MKGAVFLKIALLVNALLLTACEINKDAQNPQTTQTKSLQLGSAPLNTLNTQIPQKLADKPKDKPISVLLKNGVIACYAPTFRNGEGYISLQNCSKSPPARYDVFGRIAWIVGRDWVCATAPQNLGASTKNLILRPCVINDKSQVFTTQNNAFISHSMGLQVQDSNGFLVLSADKKANNHALSGMNEWLNTIATPVNLSISTFIAWDFATGRGTFDSYYLRNNESVKNDPIYLTYNPLNGQISQYDKGNGNTICLTSNQARGQDWNWTFFTKCDVVESRKIISTQSWNLEFFGSNNISLLSDYAGNILRVPQYGIHYGVPYTATKKYAATDRTNAPTSFFRFSNDVQNFVRFYNANLGDSLPQCPASGNQTLLQTTPTLQSPPLLKAPPLPPTFTLNDEWRRRLWQIATTTDGQAVRIGDCGVCMLHSYQIIAELNEHPNTPLTQGGYFFNTQAGQNPFVSFRSRYPLLANQLENYSTLNLPQGLTQQEAFAQSEQIYRSIALTMYPSRAYRNERFASELSQVREMINGFFSAPVGSMWIVNIYRTDRSGRQNGHAMPVIRLQEGVAFLPTNVAGSPSYERFANYLQSSIARNANEAYSIISSRYTQNVYLLFSMQIEETYQNPLNSTLSSNNCTGEGDDRHGTRSPLQLEFVNQCTGGRCLIQ